QAFANQTIPTSRIDPVALAILGRFPLPTSAGTANNFTRIANDEIHQNQFDIRIDHNFDGDSFFSRYSYFHEADAPAAPLPDGSGSFTAGPSGAIGLSGILGQQVVAGYVHGFSPRTLNETRFGYTRRSLTRRGVTLDGAAGQSLGIPGIPSNAGFQNALPVFSISGLQQIGSPASTNSDFETAVTELVDTVSQQRGRHSLKFGLDFRWERMNAIQPPNPTGTFTFSNLFTNLPGATANTTGSALASFLLGQVQQFQIDLQTKEVRPRAHIQEYFAQDAWRATRRLTLNAGLRWTLNFPSTEADNQFAAFNLQTQKLQYAGQNGFPETARTLHWHDFGPRLGMAYLVNDKTVIRSGYGLVWIEQTGITTPFTTPQFPFLQTVTQRTLDNVRPAFALSSGPTVAPIALTPDAGLGQGVFGINRDQGSGYAQQWNLTVQRELTRNVFVEVTYAGSKITHVGVPDVNINQLTTQQLAAGNALLQQVANPCFGVVPRSSRIGDPTVPLAQTLKPFPCFDTVSLFRNNTGSTNYHAGEIKFQQRLSHGLSYLVSYTHSKLIDTASSVFDSSVLTGPVANFPVADSYNSRRERDSSTGDIPNVFVASYTWELPVGPGHGVRPMGWLGALSGGWQITGVVSVQSGMPVAITQATNNNSFAGFGVQRPNVVGDVTVAQPSAARWFNTAAFVAAPAFALGNGSRNPVRGPGYRDVDIALIKHTRIGERSVVELRSEIFNLTNTAAFAQPNGVLGNAAFGTITSTVADPRVIQLGVKVSF
ncbi:MAG TPA: hypothetical protein VG892_05640, partial [Terriglobales bacterium]|nr:hypothetical protein [Terriglobales bacterium]